MKQLAAILLGIFDHLSIENVKLNVQYLSRISCDPFHLLSEVTTISSEDSNLFVLDILWHFAPANAHRGSLSVAKNVVSNVFHEGEGFCEDEHVVRVLLDVLEDLILQDCHNG